jgi:hypothetical protein
VQLAVYELLWSGHAAACLLVAALKGIVVGCSERHLRAGRTGKGLVRWCCCMCSMLRQRQLWLPATASIVTA